MVTIPEPYEDVRSLRASVMALKELVESMTGQRGPHADQVPTFADLPQAPIVPVHGVWTPTLVPTTGAYGGITYDAANFGRFFKLGRKVDIWFQIGWSGWTIGSAVAAQLVTINGAPFVAGTLPVNGYWGGGNISYTSGVGTNSPVGGLIPGGDKLIYFYWLSAGQSANFLNSHMQAAGNIWGSFSYMADQ